MAELRILRRERINTLCAQNVLYARGERASAVIEHHLHALRLLLRRLDIARVRYEPRAAARHHHRPVRKREVSGVALILLVRYEYGVKLSLPERFLYFPDIIHYMPVSSKLGLGNDTENTEPRGLFGPTLIEPPCSFTVS